MDCCCSARLLMWCRCVDEGQQSDCARDALRDGTVLKASTCCVVLHRLLLLGTLQLVRRPHALSNDVCATLFVAAVLYPLNSICEHFLRMQTPRSDTLPGSAASCLHRASKQLCATSLLTAHHMHTHDTQAVYI